MKTGDAVATLDVFFYDATLDVYPSTRISCQWKEFHVHLILTCVYQQASAGEVIFGRRNFGKQ